MARRHQHEEHQNHEAWAVPYGDLVTLLLAFFVVMYAISSVNEGKYRAVSDALSSAFGGPPRSITPIQLGETQLRGSSFDRPSLMTPGARTGPTATSPVSNVRVRQMLDMPTGASGAGGRTPEQQRAAAAAMDASLRGESQLTSLGRRIQHALAELVRQELVTVRRGRTFLEVEIQSDILFASGVAEPSPVATATVRKLGAVLREAPNAVRVEGYTDDLPIHTAAFPSNWELSAARAASVVHVLAGEGVDPGRLAVVGYGEHQPVADNATAEGRNANRRVLLVILAAPQGVDAVPEGPEIAADPLPASALDPTTGEPRVTAPRAPIAAFAPPTSHAGAD
ncbi:flagellar motor protein MotD [Luteimonas saliphila]|uniref:flagellar motor protein MotD n=1 Tax=Luteimonas saliphila TaxID=2804919 RepID=UPI00192D75CB|nr:flagellar motor protein MotD [Luteimonas saliphila]